MEPLKTILCFISKEEVFVYIKKTLKSPTSHLGLSQTFMVDLSTDGNLLGLNNNLL
jgi:hypothetical protein